MQAKGGGKGEPGAGADEGEGESEEGPEWRRHPWPNYQTESWLL